MRPGRVSGPRLVPPTVVAGIMTFLLYCVLPLGILFYVTGGKRRNRRRAAAAARAAARAADDKPT